MGDFDVLADTALSHLPIPITSSTEHHHHQQLRPTAVNNIIHSSYPSPQTPYNFINSNNQFKPESQIQDNQIILNHQSQPQTSSINDITPYHFALNSDPSQFSSSSDTQSLNRYYSSTNQSIQPFSDHSIPSTSSLLSYHQSTLQSQSNQFSHLKSPNSPLTTFTSSHQLQQQPPRNLSFGPTSSLNSPSNFSSQTLFNHTDHSHSPSNWSAPPNTNPLDLRHRSISLSTPITTTSSLSTPDNPKDYHFNRLLNIPTYQSFEPSDQIASSSTDSCHPHLSSLVNLDSHYTFNAPHNPSAFIQPNLRKALQAITNVDYSRQPDHLSGSSPPALTHTFDLSGRSSQSPANSFPPYLPSNPSPSASQPRLSQKRKFHSDCDDSPKPQRPSPVPTPPRDFTDSDIGLESGHPRMTTVLCFHASVAQKSYGQEKRFLCPPPLVRITGPYRQLPKSHRPILSMSILNEDGTTHLSQNALIGENNSNVHFKSLHISGAAKKAKHINLELSLHPPLLHGPQPHYQLGSETDDVLTPFATFRSSDCNVISKPSKKTAKARNTQSCIFNGSTICLFNRINSQTVRTKYLCVQDGQLAARAAQWSAFIIRVVRRAEDAGADGTPPLAAKTLLSSSIPGADRTVTYGSEVELVDFVTGVSSGPLVVRKVEKNTVQKDATGPVSQMQKLAFCQVHKTNGNAQYISALEGQGPSTGPLSNHQFDFSSEINASTHNQVKRNISCLGLDSEFVPIQQSFSVYQPPMLHKLQLQPPRAIIPPDQPGGTSSDEIEDSVTWTVIGVAHFSHSFIDLSHQYPQIPQIPITPFPSLTRPPTIELPALTLSLSVTGLFDAHNHPMEVWLGPIGPLAFRILEASGLNESHEGEHKEGQDSHVSLLHMAHGSVSVNRPGERRESILSVSLPSLESIYWTLHQQNMPHHSRVTLDHSDRPMSELVGRHAEGNQSKLNHIPALPITLIRVDGISFLMGHSICLSEVSQPAQNEISPPSTHLTRSLILKVI